jgi:hypothetical protein
LQIIPADAVIQANLKNALHQQAQRGGASDSEGRAAGGSGP